jgi:hypothetical protein
MHQYLIRQRTGEPFEEFRDELSRLYRSLFGIGQTGITYYWLGDVHALAPILPERGDRLFQILSPQAMISDARPQVLTGWEFSEDFTVRSIAPTRATPKPRYRSPEEALFFDRLEKMEALSLGGTAQTPGTPRQLVELAAPTALPDFAGIPQNDSSAWFFSGNRLALASAREVDLYNLLLIRLGNALQGPGIVTIRMPATLDHARFVRHYYSRAIPARAIYRRFLTAGFNLRREGGDAYNYRLVTSNFLKE